MLKRYNITGPSHGDPRTEFECEDGKWIKHDDYIKEREDGLIKDKLLGIRVIGNPIMPMGAFYCHPDMLKK